MPKTFYLLFEVVPGSEGLVDHRIESGLAHCLIATEDPLSATVKARYGLGRSGWEIKSQQSPPTEISLKDLEGTDLCENAFLEAQELGISIFIRAQTQAKELHTKQPIRQSLKKELDMQEFLKSQSSARLQGQCLFYSTSDKCNELIDAHSIQKNGALSRIAHEGYVYSASAKFTDIKRNKGKLILTKTHINSMSTFRGLCGYHDNLLFRPIDLANLLPTDEQVFLYAYRSILRERFAKECAVRAYHEQIAGFKGTSATHHLLEALRNGNRLGLENLKAQQAAYDNSHLKGEFGDVRYVMFQSDRPPTAVFSGLLYPDWGFNGEAIQQIGPQVDTLDLLTFSFAPTKSGWAFLFAWHKTCDFNCRRFIATLQIAARESRNIEDLLFGLVVKSCENTAFCPHWLQRRTTSEKQQLQEAINHGADMLQITLPDYLRSGLHAMHEWKFDTVQSNLN